MSEIHRIVFLDRDSVIANVRKPAFAHEWTEYPATRAGDTVQRLRQARASIAITNKVALSADDLTQLPDLKLIAVAATGTNIVDLAAAARRGIVVTNIRNYAVHTLPEHTFALILALRRQLLAYRADIEAGLWQQSERFCLFGHPVADLAGSRLGLFGYGALGKATAQIARAFGMEVIVHNRSRLPDAAADGVREASFDEVLETSDVISLHLPLTDATRNMLSAKELIRMKRSALLINTARGGLVDEVALADALSSGLIAGAGVDALVTEPPPADNVLLNLRLPNFILTPHSAWASTQAMQTLVDQLIDNIEAWQAGTPRNVVG
jgi:glycerate dehydrogenase